MLLLILASGSAITACLCLTNRFRLQSSAEETAAKKEADAVNAASGEPLRIRSLVQPLLAKDSPEAVCVQRAFQEPPPGPRNVSYCCHLLRLYGLEAFRHPRFTCGREVVATLTDQRLSESYFGEPIFFQTRSGIRYRDPGIQKIVNGENHRDFCLATFAELGLPLSTPMKAADGSFTLRELFRDSVENFDIKQRELAWTAIAYALYLPPGRGWANRYKESFTFDDLANALMRTPLSGVSCGGAHVLYAMTVLWRADARMGCLSDSVREALAWHLRRWATVAARAQTWQGYWTLDWYIAAQEESGRGRINFPNTPYTRLLATGHLLEWLEWMPVESQPPPAVYRRAARWLCEELETKFPIKSAEDICPCVHAVCAVRGLIGELDRSVSRIPKGG